MTIAESFLLTVNSSNRSWLVDTFVPNAEVIKFSGTERAGYHDDLAGRTCDAFAHFSLHESSGGLVLVDIQGIENISFVSLYILMSNLNKIGLMKKTLSRGKQLVLFDLMAHRYQF